MRFLMPVFAIAWAAGMPVALAQPKADQPITPLIELQSGPLTPGLVLDELPRPVHQIRLVVDARLERGLLILDGNEPVFDEFGQLVGGIQTPDVRGKGNAKLIRELTCSIEMVKEGQGKWRLYRITSPDIRNPLRVATRGSLADGGPARLIVPGPGDKPKAVVEFTPYGLAIP